MKKIITGIICLIVLIITAFYLDKITDYIASFVGQTKHTVVEENNKYTKNIDYLFVQESKDYVPYSYQDLLNIFYSILDHHWETFTIYCPYEYSKCTKDTERIINDEAVRTHLNNYVHPFNTYTNIKTSISESGEITLKIKYLYNEEQMDKISSRVDELINQLINSDMSDYDKIKTIHDYIINNAKYDVAKSNNKKSPYSSELAYGPLFQGYATCNGYTDLMAVFLTKMGFNNYKVATTPEELNNYTINSFWTALYYKVLHSYTVTKDNDESTGHVWNAVYLDKEWLHIDLTWDDPVSKDGQDYLFHTYFLVTTEAMHEADKGQTVIKEHNFNPLYYLEFN